MPSPVWLQAEEVSDVEVLSKDECMSLLTAAPVGRLGVSVDGGVDIFPVNFMVTDLLIYIRSAPGSKLVNITNSSSVAFEIDGSRGRTHWSVVVQGTADRMSFDSEIRKSGVLELSTMTSSAKWNYVRIAPFSISGRRFTIERPRGWWPWRR